MSLGFPESDFPSACAKFSIEKHRIATDRSRVEEGAWVGEQAFVAPDVTIGADAVAVACSVVLKDLPAGMVCSGNPCVPVKPRWRLV